VYPPAEACNAACYRLISVILCVHTYSCVVLLPCFSFSSPWLFICPWARGVTSFRVAYTPNQSQRAKAVSCLPSFLLRRALRGTVYLCVCVCVCRVERHCDFLYNDLRIENAEGYVLIAMYLFIYLFICMRVPRITKKVLNQIA